MAGGSYDQVAAGCVREHAPGTNFRYKTTDTHVLGMVVRRATREGLTEYLRRKLWVPLGAEHDAFWRIDGEGIEDSGAGFHATLSDISKLGQLYLDGGRPLVPESWIAQATRAHVAPGAILGNEFGYGYQWWLPGGDLEYAAIGVYNQYLYVSELHGVVIGKISANRDWGRTLDEAGIRDAQHIALFRAIAESTA
jgi:CubicO group peptidase (beta-lactamase class C family)